MSNLIEVSWQALKSSMLSKKIESRLQWLDDADKYKLFVFDGPLSLTATISKSTPKNAEQHEFESLYKNASNKILSPADGNNAILARSKITETGWSYQMHGMEFKTSQLDSVYSKRSDGSDFGYTTIRCYDAQGSLLETQGECDTNAVRTVIDWEPTCDYEIIGGMLRLADIPTENVRLWVIGVPDIPKQYGGSKEFITNMNLKYIGIEEGVRADGRAPKYLTYDATNHTNKIRLVLTHSAGYKHDLHMVFEIFQK